jgi:hypothetical protein
MRQIDAQVFVGLQRAGLAEVGFFSANPGATPPVERTPCRAYVDRDVQTVGETQQRIVGNVEISFFLQDFVPRKDLVFEVDGDTYVCQKRIRDDGSLSRWAVIRG